jgi:hypothetical protein
MVCRKNGDFTSREHSLLAQCRMTDRQFTECDKKKFLVKNFSMHNYPKLLISKKATSWKKDLQFYTQP